MPFARQDYQVEVDWSTDANNTVDLVAVLPAPAGNGLVLSRIRATLTTNDAAFIYIFRMPSANTETQATAILYAIPLYPGQAWDEDNIVVSAGEGIAVGIVNINGGSPKVVFSGYGNLETP